MKLSDLGEFGLIGRIRNLSSQRNSSTLIGIGDDAAAVKISPSHIMLVTTDLLLEDVHFDLSYTDYYSLGWKSAAVNLSDIAAMGGIPRFCLTALGIPAALSAECIYDFYRGFNKFLRTHNAVLIGGDTCSSRTGLFVSITAIGEAKKSDIITRAGARPDDRIFVTGTLGDSAAGLELLRAGGKGGEASGAKRLLQKHLRPVPPLQAGRTIADSGCASAMIDISDGLSSDLSHICSRSGVGADVLVDRIPLSRSLLKMSGKLSKPPLQYALAGGEDYELLFTVPQSRLTKLRSLKIPVTEIGMITAGKTVSAVDSAGKKRPLQPAGYDHFKNTFRTNKKTKLKRR
jgi:thiamine-monophosphate kinase